MTDYTVKIKRMDIKYRRKWISFKNHKWVAPIIRYAKGLYDKTIETNSQLRVQFLQFLPFLVASFLTGFMAFVYNRLFSYSEKISFWVYEQNKYALLATTPVAFLLSWWLVTKFAPYSKGSGIPQVMASIELVRPEKRNLIERFLSLRIILIKILSSCLKVMGGGISGREGPTIQISSSIFNQIYKWLPAWWIPISQKSIITAGAASGLAAAFNTPLGGIIFSIEELSKFHIRHYRYSLFVAIIIAGLTAQGFAGSYLYLGYPNTSVNGFMVYLGIILVAVVCGFFGAQMCKWLIRFMRFVASFRSKWKQAGIVVLCALVVASCVVLFGTDAMGTGKGFMERTLFSSDKHVDWYLPFVRMNGLIASFGSGGAGGVFAPSLSSGASFGALTAQMLHISGSDANILILVGMAAFLTAVTRAPFTSAIIIFEMTDRHSIIFFLLIGTVVANIIATFVDRKSFYGILKEQYLAETDSPLIEEEQLKK